MLEHELRGQNYNKAQLNRDVQNSLEYRSRTSVEFKLQNVSAVLKQLGEPWVLGYKPAVNFQDSLLEAVLRFLDARPNWTLATSRAPRAAQRPRVLREPPAFRFDPAPHQRNAPELEPDHVRGRIARKIDAAARDAANRTLGKAGEAFVLEFERSCLRLEGRKDLADKVRWTAEEDGDGLGYDIASFTPDGRKRLIEVKTTNGWERTPFYISSNELAAANELRDQWVLARVWNFAREPKGFELYPPLDHHVELTPTSFYAAIL